MPSRIQTLRRQAFQRQQGRCFYCSVAMWLTSPSELPGGAIDSPGYARLRCTAEHLVARSEGGDDCAENIVAACAHCNSTRHKRKLPPQPSVYREEVMGRVRRGSWHHPWVHRQGLVAAAPLPASRREDQCRRARH
jgi:5-methylcytosine-specific restriction endonuclease McrA